MSKILIVRPDHIGDFIIFSSVLKYYRIFFKDYEIHLAVLPQVKPLVENCPYVDKIITFDTKKPTLRQVRELRKIFYAKIFYPVYSRCKERDRVVILARGKEKIVFDGDNCNDSRDLRVKYNKHFTAIIDSDLGFKAEIERNAEFLSKLGCKFFSCLNPQVWFNKQDGAVSQQLKYEYEIEEKDYIILAPSTSQLIKLWESGKWVILIDKLLKISNSQIIFCGQGKDKIIVEKITRKMGFNKRIISLVNKTSLRVLARMIEDASLLIGVDSMAVHIAAAMETPNICLIGGGHFGRFYPYGDLDKNRVVYNKMDCFGCNWICKFRHRGIVSKVKQKLTFLKDENQNFGKCVKSIKVDNVIKEVEYVLGKYYR